MSVSTEIDRLQLAADGIRGKMMELGAAESGDNLTTLSQKITVLEKPNGNKGQIVGFVENNEIGAMDAPSGSGGGAIPAYIVGDTMTSGWLSETENGTALTPVDKQEYVIMTSGEWLRKHVMWMEEIGVYRLTGKVEESEELVRKISRPDSFKTERRVNGTNVSHTINSSGIRDALVLTDLQEGDIVRLRFTYHLRVAPYDGSRIQIGNPSNWIDNFDSPKHNYQSYQWQSDGSWDKTYTIIADMLNEGFYVRLYKANQSSSGNTEVSNIVNLTADITSNPPYNDYETDDVIDITESEIETIWGETAGAADPTNNVFSTEKRLWGYFIDGKPIYRKTISCGALPNATTKNIAHGISNLDRVISMGGTALNPTGNTHLPLPFASNTESVVYLAVVGNNVQIATLNDRSGFTTSYVTIYFTEAS